MYILEQVDLLLGQTLSFVESTALEYAVVGLVQRVSVVGARRVHEHLVVLDGLLCNSVFASYAASKLGVDLDIDERALLLVAQVRLERLLKTLQSAVAYIATRYSLFLLLLLLHF